MKVVYKDENSCMFTCEIGTEYPNKVLAVTGKLTAINYFLRKNLNEEGKQFAKNIEQKFGSNQ